MQTKTVKSVRENTRNYAGKNGTTYLHTITLDGPVDVEGQGVIDFEYHSLKPTCDAFVAGKEAKFEVEKKVNGNYTNYKIKPVKDMAPQFAGSTGGFTKKVVDPAFEERKQRMIIAQSSVSSAIAFYGETSGKTEEKTLEFAAKIFNWVLEKAK